MTTASDTHWSERAPRSVLDMGEDYAGNPCNTSQDRRWLWRLESHLAISGTTDMQRQMGRDLAQYLHETCDHHWRVAAAETNIPAHRQCTWCNEVVWDEDPS